MDKKPTQRVRYRERQTLTTVDLVAEQNYRIDARRRHNIAHHDWGIVRGLTLSLDNDVLSLQPGIAIDGYGHELIVPETMQLEIDGIPAEYDLWLNFCLQLCGQSRWRETFNINCTPAGTIDPLCPVRKETCDSRIHELSADDSEKKWPVFIGRVKTKIDGLEIVTSIRPKYTILLGNSVTASSGLARMQVGSELAGDRRRFAISVLDKNERWVDRLAIERAGRLDAPQTGVGPTSHVTRAVIRSETTLIKGKPLVFASSQVRLQLADLENPTALVEEILNPPDNYGLSTFLFERLWLFQPGDVKNPEKLLKRFQEDRDDVAQFLFDNFGNDVQEEINALEEGEAATEINNSIVTILAELNKIIIRESLLDEENFTNYMPKSVITEALLKISSPAPPLHKHLNRLLLEYVLSDELIPSFLLAYEDMDCIEPFPKGLLPIFVNKLNDLIQSVSFYHKVCVESIQLSAETRQLIDLIGKRKHEYVDFIRLNRLLLEDAYPQFLKRDCLDPNPSRSLCFDAIEPTPEEAMPWHMYRTVATKDETPVNQLRMEILDPGEEGDSSRYQLVIGSANSAGNFEPHLTVLADGSTTVHGHVVMNTNSLVTEGPVQPTLDDPRFVQSLLGSWLKGISDALIVYQSTLQLMLSDVALQKISEENLKITGTAKIENRGATELINVQLFLHEPIGKELTISKALGGFELKAQQGKNLNFEGFLETRNFEETTKSITVVATAYSPATRQMLLARASAEIETPEEV